MGWLSRPVRTFGPLGGYQVAKHICKHQPRILMYHRFSNPPVTGWASPDYFDRQVKYIKDRYNPYSLVELLQYQREFGKMPPHAVVITVDDGYRDFYDYAFPILRKYNVPATLFATTGFIDGRLWLWPDKITWILERLNYIPNDFLINSLKVKSGPVDDNGRRELWKQWVAHALLVSDEEKHVFIRGLADRLGLVFPDSIPGAFAPLSWNQLHEMQAFGIEIGGHTVTHPSLGRVSPAQARSEIFGCRDVLKEHLGERERTFCYPNGQPSDFNDLLPELVREAGFLGAVTAFPDAVGTRDRYLMRRHVSGDDMFQFHKAVSGVEWLGHVLRREYLLKPSYIADEAE
ncbi:hypothetical protein MspRI1_24400 [Marinobacter sp. RI1]